MGERIEYSKYCSSCGGKQVYSSLRALSLAKNKNAVCRECANINKSNPKKHKEMSLSWFSRIKKRAGERGIDFNITPEYVYKIYLRQNKECALTGTPLFFSHMSSESNASIDRIDSSKGYVKRNIQLVLKDVNFAKWTLSQKDFINMCKLVAEKHKDS